MMVPTGAGLARVRTPVRARVRAKVPAVCKSALALVLALVLAQVRAEAQTEPAPGWPMRRPGRSRTRSTIRPPAKAAAGG